MQKLSNFLKQVLKLWKILSFFGSNRFANKIQAFKKLNFELLQIISKTESVCQNF